MRTRLALVVLVVVTGLALPLQAQGDVRTFPETGHTLRGVFRVFWEANGGLPVFGYPLSEEYNDPQRGRLVQYFERARFELVPGNGSSSVELGRLGVEFAGGRTFPPSRAIANSATRRYIPETQQVIQYGFKEIWETRGGVRIFGLPISGEVDEVLHDGKTHVVQYFERSRFEFWPEYPAGQRVIITDLGRKLMPATLAPPTAAPAPVPPTAAPAPVPPTAAPAPVPPTAAPAPVPPTAAPAPRAGCHPSYPDVCIPPAPPDLDCGDIPYRRFRVVGSDPHRFDGNNDGIGCER